VGKSIIQRAAAGASNVAMWSSAVKLLNEFAQFHTIRYDYKYLTCNQKTDG